MSLIGQALRDATADQRPLIVVSDDVEAYKAYRLGGDRRLYAALLDAPTAHLVEGLEAARSNLSAAAKREQQAKRRERAELAATVREARRARA